MLSTSTEMAVFSDNYLSNTEVYNLIVAESFSTKPRLCDEKYLLLIDCRFLFIFVLKNPYDFIILKNPFEIENKPTFYKIFYFI